MKRISRYSELKWSHEFWSLVRYYRSLRLRGEDSIADFLGSLKNETGLPKQTTKFPIDPQLIDMLELYITDSKSLLVSALGILRLEEGALAYCRKMKFLVGKTATKNQSHHQSSKTLIAAVSGVAAKVCKSEGVDVNLDPQRRAIWFSDQGLHVSARNLDGAIPSLENPRAIWEIKEYWGKTKGGSKMSDAVYECHLVGLELRMFEATSGAHIEHIVFVDGKEQWEHRKSDLLRFIDLHQQGLIDHLFVGSEVETDWPKLVKKIASSKK
ncbi:MAG: hypothetical protein GXP30_09150 [Verrucomicrobia bacterium]|nr:hypothetical protein [Verrucomicrobiota bacterium]